MNKNSAVQKLIVSAVQSNPLNPWDKYSEDSLSNSYKLIKALSEILKIKDMKTANHCKGVAYYAECLGRSLGYSTLQLHALKDAASLHDIGKLMVDNYVLYKASKPTERERLQIYSHPEKGMRILECFHLNDVIVDAAWHHHERWDGTGYPDGQKGDAILQTTRIISVADVTEAMSSYRPYRKQLNQEEVLEELRKAAGTQLDPEITALMIDMIEKNQITIIG